MKRKGPVTKVYQLKIALKHIQPEIWRRVLVAGETDLKTLHHIIQNTMGWENCHLHLFRVGDLEYSNPEMEVDRAKDESSVRLFRIAPEEGSTFVYEYDFGDSWDHIVTVEAVAENDDRYPGYPVCIGGERACPPEDCGGAPGYEYLIEAIRDQKHPEHKDKLRWLGGRFDPEAFDSEAVNRWLICMG